MYDIITIGSSVVDIFVMSKNFNISNTDNGVALCQRYGAKLDVDSFIIKSGGGASNTAVGFARLGFRVATVSETGKDDFANIVLEDLHKNKVATNLIIQERKEETGGSVVMIGSDGGRTILVHRGASTMLDPKDLPLEKISRARWVHLSSLSGRLDTITTLFKELSKSHRYKLSWNPGGRELALLKTKQLHITAFPVEVFSVNKEEWALLKGVRDQIIANVPQVVITDGKKGCQVIIKGVARHFPISVVKAVDATGAGDAFITAYVAAQLRGQLPETAVSWALANSAAVVRQVGAKPGLLRLRDMEKVKSVSY